MAKNHNTIKIEDFVLSPDYVDNSFTERAICKMDAEFIVQVWKEKGFDDVVARVVRTPEYGQNGCVNYTIKTNLINGLPPSYFNRKSNNEKIKVRK